MRLSPIRTAQALLYLGIERACVVNGENLDGSGYIDELSTLGPTQVSEIRDGKITTHRWQAEDFGLRLATSEDLHGGDGHTNAETLKRLLAGERGPLRDIVLYNAATALIVAGRVTTIRDGLTMAAESIASGAAQDKLERLTEITNR